MQSAIKHGDLQEFLLAIEKEPDYFEENKNYFFELACGKGQIQIIKFIFEKGADVQSRDNTPIRWASLGGHLETVKFLWENGADVKAQQNYAIFYASKNGHDDVVEFLLEKGADRGMVCKGKWCIHPKLCSDGYFRYKP